MKKLMGKKIAITEGMTVTDMNKLNEARKSYNFKNVQTSYKKSLHKDGSGEIKVYYS